ncbi:MAG: 4Fe-4S dicluster domain-containing protein, partial [Elusimicrobia bacterium]
MTSLPAPSTRKLGLVIDLDICVGCHACAVACKEWNDGGAFGPLPDADPYGAEPHGVWFNRVHTYEISGIGNRESGIEKAGAARKSPCASSIPHSPLPIPAATQSVHFPRSCLHCETPACVTVCPTGASFKRVEDGIVLVNPDTCIGCKLCSWACPYGAREYDHSDGVMKKCTLCV